MIKSFVLLLSLVLALYSCQNKEHLHDQNTSSVYDFDSLIQAQVSLLNLKDAKITKEISSDENSERLSMEMDSSKWQKLFSPLRVLSMEKPSIRESYEHTLMTDTNSNLLISRYQLKKQDRDQNLKWLNIYYLKSLENIKKITAVTSHEGIFYHSNNRLELLFDTQDSICQLRNFNISITQKTLLKDSVNWNIHTTVIY